MPAPFMRQAALHILDEPTAALDTQAEHEIFEQFVDLTAGCTSLLIGVRGERPPFQHG